MLPTGIRFSYAPMLVGDALIEWGKSGYAPDKVPDIERLAYRNSDLERDMNQMLRIVDWHNTPRK